MDEQALAKYTRERLEEAEDAFDSYEGYRTHMSRDDVLDLYEELFLSAIKALRLAVLASLEALNLARLRNDFEKEFAEFTELTAINIAPHNDVMYSPVIEFVRPYITTIEAAVGTMTIDHEARERERLEQILASTAVIIRERSLNPERERDVQDVMYSTLKAVFPDTVRDIPIGQVSKTYKPDFGIRSLRAAVEYKFCATETEVGRALGGIYEDIHGYAGSRDWEWFYAVLYLTDSFMAPQHAEADFKIAGVPKHWKPILVYGRGERKSRVDSTSTAETDSSDLAAEEQPTDQEDSEGAT